MICYVFLGGVSLSQAETIFDNQGVEHEVMSEDIAYHPVPYGHICYPWVWNLGAWYHHHVFWNGFGWQHGYFRAMYTYHQFFNQYVWMCTWNGCNAIRF